MLCPLVDKEQLEDIVKVESRLFRYCVDMTSRGLVKEEGTDLNMNVQESEEKVRENRQKEEINLEVFWSLIYVLNRKQDDIDIIRGYIYL